MPKRADMSLAEAIESGLVVEKKKLDKEIDKQIELREKTKKYEAMQARVQSYIGDRNLDPELVDTIINEWHFANGDKGAALKAQLDVLEAEDIRFVKAYKKLKESGAPSERLKEPVKAFWYEIRERHIESAIKRRKKSRFALGEE